MSGYNANNYLDMTAQWVTIDWDDGNGSATWWALQLSSNSGSNWPADLDNMAFNGYVHNVANNSGEIIVIEDATETITNITTLGRGQTTVFNHSRVGIGTTNPQRELEIKNDAPTQNTGIKIHNNSASNAAILELEAARTSDGIDVSQILTANSGNNITNIKTHRRGVDGGEIAFFTSAAGSGDVLTQRMVIDENGNVGIGYEDPANKLSVQGVISSGNFTGVSIGGTPADANTAELGPGYLNLARDDTVTAKQILFGKNGSVHSYLETSTLGLNIGGANVGIGTDSPGAKLHVDGKALIGSTLFSSGITDGGVGSFDYQLALGGAHNVAPNTGDYIKLLISGVQNDATGTYYTYFEDENDAHVFSVKQARTGISRAIDVYANGRLGINETAPEYDLEVAPDDKPYKFEVSGAGGHAVQDGRVETKGHAFALGGGGSVLISDNTVSSEDKWTAIFKGHWANNYEGGGLKQTPPVTVVSEGYPYIANGSTSVLVDIDPSTNRLRVTNQNGSYAVHFTGTIEIFISTQGSMGNTAPIKTNGIELKPNQNIKGSGGGTPLGSYANGLILDTPLYKEYQYYWSGNNRTHTTTLTCGSYFMAEVVYVTNQTNSGGNSEGIHRYIRGKWANNYTSHNWVPFEDSGSTDAVSLTISATNNSAADSYGNAGPYSGRLTITEVVNNGSYSGTRLLVRVWYAEHNIYHDEA